MKVESPRDKESDNESDASDYSMESVSTVVSELQVAIDEEMSTWEPIGLTHIAANVEPVFEHVNENITGQDEDVVMEEVEDVGYPRPFHDSGVPDFDAACPLEEVEDVGHPRPLHDSGVQDIDAVPPLEEEQRTAKIVSTLRNSTFTDPSKKLRSRIPRPKPVTGGPNPLIEVAFQTPPQRTRSPVKLFAKSVENLKLISELQDLQTANTPSLHQLAASIYDQDTDSMMDLMKSHLPQCQDVFMPDEEGNTAGHVALSSPLYIHRPEFPTFWWITTWLRSGNNGIKLCNSKGETILHYAAKNGYSLVVNKLLDRGADPNAIDNSGRSVIQVCDDALQAELARMPPAARSNSAFEEARGAKCARLYDCARLLRRPCRV